MRQKIKNIYLALGLMASFITIGNALPITRAQSPNNRVGLVVEHGDGSVTTRCVEFSEQEISGYEALTRSKLEVETAFDSGQGAAICRIENEGCPVASCLTCDVPNYWAYWHLADGASAWTYSQIGAGSHTVHNGDVEGWSWGAGDPPSVVPFDQICAPPATDMPQPPTDTPLPPTETPAPPTATPMPAAPSDTPPPPTPVVWFRLENNPIPAGDCTMVRWDTTNAHEIYLDGESVGIKGEIKVCPTASQEYRLQVTGADGQRTHTLTLGVTEAEAATAPTSPPTAPPSTPTSSSSSSVSQPTPTASPSPTPPPATTMAPKPSSTPARAAAISSPSPQATQPTFTPTSSGSTQAAAISEQSTAQGDAHSTSIFQPIGYILFSVIAGGLLGWLAFIIMTRGNK